MTVLIPGLYGLDTATAFRALEKDPQKYIAKFSKDKTVQREVDYFNQKAPKITSIDDLVKDRRLLQFVLDAYGLGSEINNAGRIKKILSQDPTDSSSLVNKLSDPKFKALATGMRLDLGMSNLTLKISRDGIVKNYIQNEFEEALGDQDNALREAAYFARTANTGSIGDVYNVLGDKILRDVVQTATNIPAQLAIQPVTTQAAAIARKVDVTKFGSTATSSVSTAQLTRAKSDYNLLDTTADVSDAALKQVQSLQSQLSTLIQGYENLSTNTDPNGTNAALITQQNTAVPELVRYNELLQSGDSAMTSVKNKISSLSDLITQAKQSGSNIASLKTQFDALVTSLNSTIANAAITAPDGSTQNILLNGAADTLSTQINTSGTTVTINRYDVTNLQSIIADTQTAFDSVTGSGDSANLLTTQSRLLRALDKANLVANQITTDTTALTTAVSGQKFYTTLNSTDLLKGKDSVDDATSRIDQIKTLLHDIAGIATESAARGTSDDRSDLQTTFDTKRAELRDLIINASDAGFDNLLNNSPDHSYEIINGQTVTVKSGYDLLTQIADVIDTGDITTQSGASALKTSAVQVEIYADRAKTGLTAPQNLLNTVISSYDPKGSLDAQVKALADGLDNLVSGAAVNGKNLLSLSQTDIKLDLSTGSLSFRAQPNFASDVGTLLDDAVAQIGNGSNAVLSALDLVQHKVSQANFTLSSDNRIATLTLGRLSGTIDLLTPKTSTSDANNPYKVNAFTEKFLTRYLTQAASSKSNGATNYLTMLFNGSASGTDASGSLMSLALSLKA